MAYQLGCLFTCSFFTFVCGIILFCFVWFDMSQDSLFKDLEPTYIKVAFLFSINMTIGGIVGMFSSHNPRKLRLGFTLGLTTKACVGSIITGILIIVSTNTLSNNFTEACDFDKRTGNFNQGYTATVQASYDSLKNCLLNCRRNGLPEAIGLFDCGKLGRDDAGNLWTMIEYRDLFDWAERKGGCGGFCMKDLPLFGYSNLDGFQMTQAMKGMNRKPCYEWIVRQLVIRGGIGGVVLITLALPSIATIIITLWTICSPPPIRRKTYEFEMHYPTEGDEYDSEEEGVDGYSLASPQYTRIVSGQNTYL